MDTAISDRSFRPAAPDGGLLQSPHWEKFQKAIGKRAVRIVDEGGDSALMIRNTLPVVGGYFFVPRGPIIQDQRSDDAGALVLKMIEAGIKERAGWIRVEPQTEQDLETIKRAVGGRYTITKSKKNHEPAQTLMLDLTKSQDQLLLEMKPKTRYNIRLSMKKGVKVFASRDKEHVQKFCGLIEETAKRDRITAHPKNYYVTMLASLEQDALELLAAEYEGTIIAANLVSFYGGVATYLHGGSSDNQRNVMAPFLLQWESIILAQQKGCIRYDFGGVKIMDAKDQESGMKNDWEGITRFKRGFCPDQEPMNFPGCYDIILKPMTYQLYRFLQNAKDRKAAP